LIRDNNISNVTICSRLRKFRNKDDSHVDDNDTTTTSNHNNNHNSKDSTPSTTITSDIDVITATSTAATTATTSTTAETTAIAGTIESTKKYKYSTTNRRKSANQNLIRNNNISNVVIGKRLRKQITRFGGGLS